MDAAGNVVLGKRKRTAAPKYVHDPELDQVLGEDSNDEMDEEDEEDEEEEEEDESGPDEEDESSCDDEDGHEDESASDKEEEDGEDEQGQDMEGEVWRPVLHRFLPEGAPAPGKRVLYEVSNLGIARSLQKDTPRLLKPILHQNGYHRYSLCYGGHIKPVFAHDLVLGTFEGPYPGRTHLWHIDHIDRNKHNNALSNLRYMKAKHNLSHSRKPRVRKGPSTGKPRAWSYVAPDSPDRLQWRQHLTLPELEEGHVRYAAGHAPGGKKKGHMLKPRADASGHLHVCWRAGGRQVRQFMHRLVYRTWVGHFPANESAVNGKMAERLVLDHKDNNQANNHADNLEFVSHTANSRKRAGRNTNNTSGVNGVFWRKGVRRWMAYIPVDGKSRHLGYFLDKRDAEKARLDAEKAYW